MFREMTWDEWEKEFKPITDDQGPKCFETYGDDFEIVRNTEASLIWTVIDGPGRFTQIVSGYHLVNRLEYHIATVPFDLDDIIKVRNY